MNGSRGYSQEALRRLETGTYRGRKQQYRTSEEQTQAVRTQVPALEGLTRSPVFDQTGNVDTANARARYEQRINHTPIGQTNTNTQPANDENYVVKRDRYDKLMQDSRLANDIRTLAEVNYNNANQDATVSQEWADEYGARNITGGMNKKDFINTLSRRYGLTPEELNDMALTFHSDEYKAGNEAYGKQLEKLGEDHSVLGSVGSFVGTLGSGIEGAYNNVVGGISGDDRYLSNMFRTTKNSLREGAKKNIKSDFGKGAYDVTMGIGDMAVGAAAGSAPVILAGNTANEAQASALERGNSVRKSSLYGAGAGALDYITNRIGLDKAKKLAVDSIKSTGIKKFLAQNAIAGAGEAGENIIQDLGQSLIDTLINGKNSEFSKSYESKIADGMSDSQAFKEVAKEYAEQLGMSAALGFGMGSAMQAGTSVIPKIPQLVADTTGKIKNAKIDDIVRKNADVQDILNGKVSEEQKLPENSINENIKKGSIVPVADATDVTSPYTADTGAESTSDFETTNVVDSNIPPDAENVNIPDDRLSVDEMRQLGLDDDAIRAQIEALVESNNRRAGLPEDFNMEEARRAQIEALQNAAREKSTAEPSDGGFKNMQRLFEEARAKNAGEITDTDVNLQTPSEPQTPNLSDISDAVGKIPSSDVNFEEGGYNPETGEYELYETGHSPGGEDEEPTFVFTESAEPPREGFAEEGKSRVVTNSAINGGIISRFDYDNDPVLQEIAKYEKHNNDTTYFNAFNNVKENGAKLLEEYNDGSRTIDNDQDVDQAMILLQNLSDQLRNGADDVKTQRDLLLSKLRQAGTTWGQNIQAFAKWNDTPEGAIINGERILNEPVKSWKSTNQQKVAGNNRIAKALADMGNKWKQATEKPEISHDELKERVRNEINKEFGSVEQLFNDADIEYLTILAENKDIPIWQITSEIEHKLNTGEWYSLDESTEIPRPTNQRLQSALDSLVAEERIEPEPPTLEQITEEVRNTLDNEFAGTGEFTDDDVNYLANLINNGATKAELADALNTKLATGRFAISEDTESKVNQLFEYANQYDPESREAVEAKTAAYQLIANEVVGDATPLEKFEAWRYLAMLGNPKTMIRNKVGNDMFGAVTGVSNTLSAAMEAGTDKLVKKLGGKGIQRTKAILNPAKDRALIKASGKDAEVSRYATLSGTQKYEKSTKDAIRRAKSTFNSKLVQLYEKATDAGISDYSAVKRKYSTSLAGYLKANGLDESVFDADNTYKGLRELSRKRVLTDAERSQMESLEDLHKTLEKARDFAVKQAEYATFHEDNAIAQFLTSQSQKARNSEHAAVRGLGYLIEGTLPFKKTPANILRSGVELSPLGAIDSIRKTGKLIYENTGSRKGNLDDTYTKKSKLSGRDKTVEKTLAADVLDSWSKTLTGSGLLALGYYLKSKGILNSSDKDEKYQDDLEGIQNYSITINGKTYTIDWAAPAVMPMLVGAEISKINERNGVPDQKWYGNIDEAIGTVNALLDPIFETSMMQGVKNTLESAANEVKYNDEGAIGGILGSMATTMGTSYLTQALPTLSGQIARTVDPIRRTTDTASDSNFLSSVEKQGRKLMNKIPGLSYANEAYRDAYGRTQNNSPFNNPLGNLVYQMASPAYISDINTTVADQSARKAYEGSKDSDAFATWKSKVTVDGVKLDPKQMATYREKSGQANYKIREALSKESWFNQLSGDRQTEILHNVNTLVDKIGKEAVGYPQDNKDLEIYKEGGIPALLEKYQDKQINKQIEEQTGLTSSSNAAKEIKAEIKAGNTQAAEQKIEQAKAEEPKRKAAKDLGIKQESYDKVVNAAGANADKIINALPELKRNGITGTNAYLTFVQAAKTDPGLSTATFVKTFNAIDTDNSNGIKQDEMLDYFNKNHTKESEANKMWNMYGLEWKQVPYLKADGTWGKKKAN